MEIHSFYEPDSGTFTHLVTDPKEKAAALIDPVWVFDAVSGRTDHSFIDRVLVLAERKGCRLEWVLETHAHADHLTAADWVRRKTGAKIACGRGICDVQKNFVRVFNMQQTPIDGSQFDRLLSEGDVIRLGGEEIRVLETPGHTGDGITYLAGNAAFIGDTLFAPARGTARCDFPGGDAGQLFDSIQKLYQLPEETRLYLCHDYPDEGEKPIKSVTVAQSRKSNIHVTEHTDRDAFISLRTSRDSRLGLPRLILPSLQVNIVAGALPAADANGVSYLRTPLNRTIAEMIKGD